ncbi:hypothetical protein VTJ04DRAFT_10019 [Mycothermus thermophilus]|uniref:uncharacterized protein n=1 Tax=Humicola insolens TaxID=85995 RepID=UPI0037440638
MLRQAARVPRICGASFRLLQWPRPLPTPALPSLLPHHVRHLRTSARAALSDSLATDRHEALNSSPSTPTIPGNQQRADSEPFLAPREEDYSEEYDDEAEYGQLDLGEAAWDPRPHSLFDRPSLALLEHRHRLLWRPNISVLRGYSLEAGIRLKPLIKDLEVWDKGFRKCWERLLTSGCPIPEKVPHDYWSPELEMLDSLLACESTENMTARWLEIDATDRRDFWPLLMLECIKFYPNRVYDVFRATFDSHMSPPWVVVDIFCFLILAPMRLPRRRREPEQAKLAPLLLHVLRNSGPMQYWLRQWVLGKLFAVCSPDTAATLFRELKLKQHVLHWNTRLRAASVFASDTKYKLAAVELLEEIVKEDKLPLYDRRCAALATAILTLPPGTGKGQAGPVDVQVVIEAFERMVELGLSPNIVTCTAMLRSFCESGQLDSGWKIYDMLKSQGLPLDAYVFSTLLSSAKRANDLDMVIRVLEEVPPNIWQDSVMWNELLDTIHKLAAVEVRIEAGVKYPIPGFNTMLQLYSRFFKLDPLLHLIPEKFGSGPGFSEVDDDRCEWKFRLSSLLDALPVRPPDDLVEPDVRTLTIMFTAYVRSFATAYPILAFYSRFRNSLRQLDPLAVSLATGTTIIFDAILHALCAHAGMLRVAVDIVNDMIADSTSSKSSAKPILGKTTRRNVKLPVRNFDDPPDPIPAGHMASNAFTEDANGGDQGSGFAKDGSAPQPKQSNDNKPHLPEFRPQPPSVHTWSILMQAFLNHGQPHQAIRVLRIMQAHGVRPDLVTYNMLIHRYSSVRNVQRVIELLKELGSAGFYPDAHSFRYVSKLSDPKPALDLMESMATERYAARWEEIEKSTAKALARTVKRFEDEREKRAATQALTADKRAETIAETREFIERLESKRRQKLYEIAKQRRANPGQSDTPPLKSKTIRRMTNLTRLKSWENFVRYQKLDDPLFVVTDAERRARLYLAKLLRKRLVKRKDDEELAKEEEELAEDEEEESKTTTKPTVGTGTHTTTAETERAGGSAIPDKDGHAAVSEGGGLAEPQNSEDLSPEALDSMLQAYEGMVAQTGAMPTTEAATGSTTQTPITPVPTTAATDNSIVIATTSDAQMKAEVRDSPKIHDTTTWEEKGDAVCSSETTPTRCVDDVLQGYEDLVMKKAAKS